MLALGHPVLWLLLVTRVDTPCYKDFDMYCSLYHIHCICHLENSCLTIFTRFFVSHYE